MQIVYGTTLFFCFNLAGQKCLIHSAKNSCGQLAFGSLHMRCRESKI
jgi:hypothetical protein